VRGGLSALKIIQLLKVELFLLFAFFHFSIEEYLKKDLSNSKKKKKKEAGGRKNLTSSQSQF
jgi:hypothetical protein